jgi:Spy/CpxP family protein refolding chaperone
VALVERALQVFEGDMNPAQVEALRNEQAARAKATGDAVVQALTEINRVLSPEQRRVLTAYVRKHLHYMR